MPLICGAQNTNVSRCGTPALGAGSPRFKSGRPDQDISSQYLMIRDYCFTSELPFNKAETGGFCL